MSGRQEVFSDQDITDTINGIADWLRNPKEYDAKKDKEEAIRVAQELIIPHPISPDIVNCLDLSAANFTHLLEGLLPPNEIAKETRRSLELVVVSPLFSYIITELIKYNGKIRKYIPADELQRRVLQECLDHIQLLLGKVGKGVKEIEARSGLPVPIPLLQVSLVSPNISVSQRYIATTTGSGDLKGTQFTAIHTLAARTAILPLLGFELDQNNQLLQQPADMKNLVGRGRQVETVYVSNKIPTISFRTSRSYVGIKEVPSQLCSINERLTFIPPPFTA